MTPKTNWLARLRDFIASFRRRDVNTINVGTIESGAHDINVAAGRFIFQSNLKIGALVVPAVPVLIGVIVFLLALALGTYLYFVPDKMPDGTFNIAVAQFTEMDANQQLVVTANSQLFSAYAFNSLRDELARLSLSLSGSLKPVVWHDNLFPWTMRAQIGFVSGVAPSAREADAKTRATNLRARVLVYGNVDKNQTPAYFVPEVYVVPVTSALDEMFGRYQFGAPIPLQKGDASGANWAKGLSQTRALDARQQALAQFTIGLLYDLDGLHEPALSYFQSALKILQDAGVRQDIESVYYFIGRQYLFLAEQKQSDAEPFFEKAVRASSEAEAAQLRAQGQAISAQAEPFIVNAADAFQKSFENNRAFARAHFGLAGVARLRALRQPPRERIEKPEFLNRALAEQQEAIKLAEQANEPLTALRVRLSMGTTYFLQGEGFLFRDEWNAAMQSFDQTIALTEGQLTRLEKNYRSLAEGYLTLGNTFFDKGYALGRLGDAAGQKNLYRQSIGYYEKCIALKGIEPTLDRGAVTRCERYKLEVETSQ